MEYVCEFGKMRRNRTVQKEKIVNLPNILALVRLLLVPVVVWLLLSDRTLWAFVCFLAACLTDLLDGYIARRYQLITQLGIFLDPLADKMMAVWVIVAFTVKGVLPLGVTVVIFVKELLMLLGGLLTAKNSRVVLPSNRFGKIAAFVFNTAIGTCFLHEYLPFYRVFVYVALAGSVASMVQYAWRSWDKMFPKKS